MNKDPITADPAAKMIVITETINIHDKGKNALSGLHVGQMVMDGKGRIWVSTYTRLNCINPNNMKVVQVATLCYRGPRY